ncbi:hypothetical protein Prum_036090 [Phytohabitans rumicis]|uniref:Uncharacterized protein n=1 Tax=Phytohabitans rumicis TaxID=1076125 RepID=A0A6V8L7I8_9ACTN|nr:hypothetical protein Prum_036090 [Phytohabitans rumicis]
MALRYRRDRGRFCDAGPPTEFTPSEGARADPVTISRAPRHGAFTNHGAANQSTRVWSSNRPRI